MTDIRNVKSKAHSAVYDRRGCNFFSKGYHLILRYAKRMRMTMRKQQEPINLKSLIRKTEQGSLDFREILMAMNLLADTIDRFCRSFIYCYCRYRSRDAEFE